MKRKKMYRHNLAPHQRAIRWYMGHIERLFNRGATTYEVARWMNVTKPTARKYLRLLVAAGVVFSIKERRTGNSDAWHLVQTPTWDYMKTLESDAQLYASRVLGIVLQ